MHVALSAHVLLVNRKHDIIHPAFKSFKGDNQPRASVAPIYSATFRMADPFSIAAGVVSVTAPALQAISLFFSALDRIQKAPPTIRTLSDNVRKTEGTIRMVERIEEETWALLGAEVAEYSKMMVGQCGQACELVRRNIEHCTRHSADGRMSWRDRTKIGLLKPNLIKALSAQVEYCQLAVNSTVSIATL